MTNTHCRLCMARIIPVFRAMCGDCFNLVPWKQRSDFLRAWRRRVTHPVEWQEELIEVRQWYIHSRREPPIDSQQ